MRITFLGGGNMASALIGGLLARSTQATDLQVIDPSVEQRQSLASRFGIVTHGSADARALACDVIVLAVKPQQMREAATTIAPLLTGQLVISVAAGIRAADLSRWLAGHTRIVRAMPNTPALIGMGVAGLAAMEGLEDKDREQATAILAAVGEVVWVTREEQLDAVTAISGSGPAYVFYFMESMFAAARQLGLDEAQARTLTLQTFAGAAQLALRSDESPAVLRERVTSRGGTTAAALSVLMSRGVLPIINDAVAAADRRSAELGDEFGRG